MGDISSIVPICIHSMAEIRDINDNCSYYLRAMSILLKTVYNNMTVTSEWEKIMEL